MNRIFTLIIVGIFMLGFTRLSHSQTIKLSTFDLGATYTQATKFNDDSVDHAENYGYSLALKFQVHRHVRVGILFNYTPLQVTEYDPWVAMKRTGWEVWSRVMPSLTSYINYKDTKGNPLYDIKWYYTTYYYNYEMLFNVEVLPITNQFFQPYFSIAGGPVSYYTASWIYSDWKLNIYKGLISKYPDFSGVYRYDGRFFIHKKNHGWYWPISLGAGFDIMFLKYLGFQASGYYLFIAKNHFRNKTDAYFRLKAGLVFHH